MHAIKPWKLINAKNKQISVLSQCINRYDADSEHGVRQLMDSIMDFKGKVETPTFVVWNYLITWYGSHENIGGLSLGHRYAAPTLQFENFIFKCVVSS